MKNVVFSFGNDKKPNIVKPTKKKTILTYHDKIDGRNEYYTYINENGEEEKIDVTKYNIIKKSSSLIVASKVIVNKIDLEYVEPKEKTEYQKPYFTYNNGQNIFLDKPEFDESTNTYFGYNKKLYSFEQRVQLFKED